MGFERIVSILQDVSSNYKTDLFMPLIRRVQELTGQTDAEREANLTPYRVIADHAPGNRLSDRRRRRPRQHRSQLCLPDARSARSPFRDETRPA